MPSTQLVHHTATYREADRGHSLAVVVRVIVQAIDAVLQHIKENPAKSEEWKAKADANLEAADVNSKSDD